LGDEANGGSRQLGTTMTMLRDEKQAKCRRGGGGQRKKEDCVEKGPRHL
jgi:hypothetical protein